MHDKIIQRWIHGRVKEYLEIFPVVGIVGPRQCGKSTLAKYLIRRSDVYLDLENQEDLLKISNSFNFFRANDTSLVVLDEIQYVPQIFVDIKSYVDKNRRVGKFLALGSASPHLIKQSAESLAGRIGYVEMSGFLWIEIKHLLSMNEYCFTGGYPESVLATDNKTSMIWIKNYIRTIFNRDIAYLAPGISSNDIVRFFQMLVHLHGQKLNISKLAKSLDLNYRTIKKYLYILNNAYLIFSLPAYSRNTGKRITKSPKIYISDSGIVSALMNINSVNELFGHPIYGFSFEGMIIMNIKHLFQEANLYYYQTSNKAELDCIIEWENKLIAVEVKSSSTPNITRGFWNAIEDLQPDETWIVAQVDERVELKENVYVSNFTDFVNYYINTDLS